MVVEYQAQEKIGTPQSYPFPYNGGNPTMTRTGSTTSANSNTTASTTNRFAPNASSTTLQPTAQRQTSISKVAPSGQHITGIKDLNMYNTVDRAVRCRVVSKSDIKHWSNDRGEGKLFSVVLSDASGEIRATAFKNQVDAFYSVLEEGKVYYFSKFRMGLAKAQYAGGVKNDYELTFDNTTTIEPCLDCDDVPQAHYEFVSIGDLMKHNKDEIVGKTLELF